ncbi:hypothetical protein ACJ73_04553 [Blastomyces percursus]|uniref:Uncharacterized protein n=1 Tax=Blastomyces percursus TaxID=1658174 RepID=A0A1J9R7W1_9EURO|nr:hypothetical protein ACJ73_04553 [Blastomyces percursus]
MAKQALNDKPTLEARSLRRPTILMKEADDPETVENITEEEFLEYVKTEPKRVWNVIGRLGQYLNSEIEKQNAMLKQRDEQINGLADELESCRNLITRRAIQDAQEETATTSSIRGGPSNKMADPEPLSDGKDPEFEQWMSRMLNKLDINRDHFSSEKAKVAYIESRTKGEAAKHLAPRMRPDHPERYQTANDVFNHLKEILRYNALCAPEKALSFYAS